MSVNWDKIISRAAVLSAATPDHPATVKRSVVDVLKTLNPDTYIRVQKKIETGAYLLE